ncbi:MAG: gliding motility-associated C-terminal domain-containing protein [Cytophagales bacterium]
MSKKLVVYIFSMVISSTFVWGQQGPAGVGNNDGVSALRLWLDADQGLFADTLALQKCTNKTKVKLWKDLSGSQNHVYATSDSSAPFWFSNADIANANGAVRFYKNLDSNNLRNFLVSKKFDKTNDISIYCVFHPTTKADGNNVTPASATTFSPDMWYYGCGIVDCPNPGFSNDISLSMCDTSIVAGVGDSTKKEDYCIKSPLKIAQTQFASIEKNAWSGTLVLSRNGLQKNAYQVGTQPVNDATNYFIGANSNVYYKGLSPFFDGSISQVLIYNKILNAAEKIVLENYISAKYNIQIDQKDIFKYDLTTLGDFDNELVGVGKATDGSKHLSAKGEGILHLFGNENYDFNEFVLLAHNKGNTDFSELNYSNGIDKLLNRQWIFDATKDTSLINLDVNISGLNKSSDQIVLVFDMNKNGDYSDEILNNGIVYPLKNSNNILSYRDLKVFSGLKFTIGILENPCQTPNCQSFFTPNGDGEADTYFVENKGSVKIYNKTGNLVKSIMGPAYWDGTDNSGNPLAPGIYFVTAKDNTDKTVTLIK